MRKLGEDLSRANSRLSVARLELERLRRDAEKSAEQRERNRTAVEEKERLRAEQRRGARSASGRSWKSWKARQPPSAKSMPRRAPSWPDWKSATAASAAPWAGWSSSSARPPTAATRSRPEIERLGEQRARLLADNIELDQQVGRSSPSRSPRSKRGSTRWPSQDAGMREALRAGEEELKVLRAAVQECAREAVADRSGPGAQAGRAEVPRRDQPQGTELPGGGTGRRRRAASPMPTRSPKPSSQCNEVRSRIEGLGAGERRGHGGISGGPAAPRIPQRAAAGPDRFHPRHGEGHPGDRPGFAPEVRRGVRSHQRQFPRRLPDAVRRRHGRDAPDRPGEPRRFAASISSARLPASGCRTCCCSRAARRRWRRSRC